MSTMPPMGRITVSESCRIRENTPAFHAAGVVPTCAATSPTEAFTLSNSPPRFPMMPSMSRSFSQPVSQSVRKSIGGQP